MKAKLKGILGNTRRSIKYFLHRVRLFIALLFGIRKSRMARIVDSVIFELRLLCMMIAIVIGFYVFNLILDNPSQSSIIQLTIKFNAAVSIIIVILMFRVLFRLNNNLNHRCDIPITQCDNCKKYSPVENNKAIKYTKLTESKHDRD